MALSIDDIDHISWDFDDTLYPKSREWLGQAVERLFMLFTHKFYEGRDDAQVREQYLERFFAEQGSHNAAWTQLQRIPPGYDLSGVGHYEDLRALVDQHFSGGPYDPGFVEESNMKVDRRPFLAPDPKILEMFGEFRLGWPGIEHSIFSNSTYQSVGILMDHLGIKREWFKFMQFCDGVTIKKKPDTSGYLALPEQAGVPAERILYVGDSTKKDIRPAKTSGLPTAQVWVEEGKTSEADIIVYHPAELIDRLTQ